MDPGKIIAIFGPRIARKPTFVERDDIGVFENHLTRQLGVRRQQPHQRAHCHRFAGPELAQNAQGPPGWSAKLTSCTTADDTVAVAEMDRKVADVEEVRG